MSIFSLIDFDESINISNKQLKIELSLILSTFNKILHDSTKTISLSEFLKLFNCELFNDGPHLRHWLYISKGLIASINRGVDPSPEFTSHFKVDSLRGERLLELHFIRLLEIYSWELLGKGLNFSFEVPFELPREIHLSTTKTLHFGETYRKGFVISEDFGVLNVRDTNNKNLETIAVMVTCGMSYSYLGQDIFLPINYDIFNSPFFSTAAIVQSRHSIKEWESSFLPALDLMNEFDSLLFGSILHQSRYLLPLHNSSFSYGSASSEKILGLTYVPAIKNIGDIAECILHESMHQVLFRVETMADVLETGTDQELYYSPWRSDARPIRMCIHGAYVFTGISAFWLRLLEANHSLAQEDFVLTTIYKRAKQIEIALAQAFKYGKLTAFGEELVNGIDFEIKKLYRDSGINSTYFPNVDREMRTHMQRYSHYAR
jgi:hypothetical protein